MDGQLDGMPSGFACGAVDDLEHLGKGPSDGLRAGPARHAFGDQIEIGDVAGEVGTEDSVSYRVECDLRAFLFCEQRLLDRFPLGYVTNDLAETVHLTLLVVH